MLRRGSRPTVLHLAALRDRDALETLWRTGQVIAAAGLAQVLLTFDDGESDECWPAAFPAEVRALPCSGLSVVARLRVLELHLSELVREKTVCAVHLHGWSACLLGVRVLRRAALQCRVVLSPHAARLRLPWACALLAPLLQRQLPGLTCAPLATSLVEAQALGRLLNRSAEVLPQVVAQVFFAVSKHDALRPRIIASGFGRRAVDVAARLSVLFNSRAARVPFAWLGMPDAPARTRLEAANVEVIDVVDEVRKAELLSQASFFLDASVHDHVAPAVPEAMAVGVPCIASDTPAHHALIRHG